MFFYQRFRKYRHWLIFLLTAIFTVSFFPLHPSYSQTSLTDIEGHWAQPCIQQLAQRRIISGYPDGTFRPDASVTRAEFAAIVTNAFPDAATIRDSREFRDIPRNYWATEKIRQAYQTGFLSGYPNGVFQPTQKIPRVQVLVALAAGLNYTPSLPVDALLSQTFADTEAIPNYAKNGVAAAAEKQLVVNYPQVRKLQPNELASRGEVAAFVCQAVGIEGVVAKEYIANPTKAELRGVWLTNIDSDVLFSREGLSAAVDKLDELNFNTLYPTVWNNGYTLYPSSVAKDVTGIELDPEPGLQGRDMLEEVVALGKNKGMAVIPWFEFGFMAPADSQLAKLHPDWLVERRDGSTIWLEGGKIERVWLNPLHPEVQEFLTDLVTEIVGKYDVDGIQFDDHFGYPSDFGYDDFTANLYRDSHNGDAPPNDYQDEEWLAWRADKITEYMESLFREIKKENSSAIVSVSPNPQEFSYNSYLLDWEKWERKGLIEELLVQVYRSDLAKFQEELKQPPLVTANSHIPTGIGILSGIKPRQVEWEQIAKQVESVRDENLGGMSFFFYETLWNLAPESVAERQAGLQKIFGLPVERPVVSSNK